MTARGQFSSARGQFFIALSTARGQLAGAPANNYLFVVLLMKPIVFQLIRALKNNEFFSQLAAFKSLHSFISKTLFCWLGDTADDDLLAVALGCWI